LVKYFSTTKFHDAASLYPEMVLDMLERIKFLNSFLSTKHITTCTFPRFKVTDRRERPHQRLCKLRQQVHSTAQSQSAVATTEPTIIKEPTVKFPKDGHIQEHRVASSVKGGKQDFSIHNRDIPYTVYMTTN